MARKDVDMTQGNILKHYLAFAAPLAVGLLFQQLYNAVDAAIIGNFGPENALGAVTSTGSIEGFRLYPNIIYDNQRNRYLLIGFVGEDSDMSIRHIQTQDQQSDMMGPFIY